MAGSLRHNPCVPPEAQQTITLQEFTRAQIDEIWRQQEKREAERRERIRQAVAESEAPLPDELAKQLSSLTTSTDAPSFGTTRALHWRSAATLTGQASRSLSNAFRICWSPSTL